MLLGRNLQCHFYSYWSTNNGYYGHTCPVSVYNMHNLYSGSLYDYHTNPLFSIHLFAIPCMHIAQCTWTVTTLTTAIGRYNHRLAQNIVAPSSNRHRYDAPDHRNVNLKKATDLHFEQYSTLLPPLPLSRSRRQAAPKVLSDTLCLPRTRAGNNPQRNFPISQWWEEATIR